MKCAQCARSESVEIDRRMPTFVGSRHAMKLLLRIASPGIENSQAKIVHFLRGHRLPNCKPSHSGHSERSRGTPWHTAGMTSRDVSTSLDMTARLTISALLVDISRRLRRRSEEGARLVFLIERFHRDGTTDLGRLPLLRLHWNRFSNRCDRHRLANLRRGFRS